MAPRRRAAACGRPGTRARAGRRARGGRGPAGLGGGAGGGTGFRAPPVGGRLHRRRVRLRRRPDRQRDPPRAATAVPAVVPRRDDRHAQRAGRGRRARRGQPLRHAAARLADDGRRAARRPPGAAAPADARRRSDVPPARRRRARAQAGQHAGLPARRGAADVLRRAGRGLAGGFQGHRQAVPRPLQAAAVRPRRLRLGGAAHRRADHSRARSSGPRRSTPRSATSSRWPGCSARRTSRSRRCSRCWGRSG